MRNHKMKTAGFLLIAGSLVSLFFFSACNTKKDVSAKGTQPVQYRLMVKDSSGNATYTQTVTAYE
ncbi:MAG: hypothetical protein P4L51_27740 [Puia sp.]|nr:hypothetical protein [Puia sp.]